MYFNCDYDFWVIHFLGLKLQPAGKCYVTPKRSYKKRCRLAVSAIKKKHCNADRKRKRCNSYTGRKSSIRYFSQYCFGSKKMTFFKNCSCLWNFLYSYTRLKILWCQRINTKSTFTLKNALQYNDYTFALQTSGITESVLKCCIYSSFYNDHFITV